MNVFVSVTTTQKRLGIFYYSLFSLKRQDFNDFQIVVNISREPYLFDDGIENIPDWMVGDNIEVNFVDNIGSYYSCKKR
jgi:hypothetical protein